MTFAGIFSNLATAFSGAFGGPYVDGVAKFPGAAVFDAGGSIITPAAQITFPCQVQVDSATEAMRADAGFLATDVRLIVLGLTRLDATATIAIASGDHAGTWRLMSVQSDPVSIGYECRGRKL